MHLVLYKRDCKRLLLKTPAVIFCFLVNTFSIIKLNDRGGSACYLKSNLELFYYLRLYYSNALLSA